MSEVPHITVLLDVNNANTPTTVVATTGTESISIASSSLNISFSDERIHIPLGTK